MLVKRRYAMKHHDHLRRALIFEPRGHADMYGAVLTAPVTRDGDLGVLFLHNEGFSTMCGHGVIALVTALLETRVLRSKSNPQTVRLDTPAGRVTAKAELKRGFVEKVSFQNVPSFVYRRDLVVEIPRLGSVRCDVVFGGTFYAYCDAADLGVQITAHSSRRLIDLGMKVKRAVMKELEIRHPVDEDLGFLYGTIIYEKAGEKSIDYRNVCVFADGQVDRSPTGTGVSGWLALEHTRGNLRKGERFVVQSIVGTEFSGKVIGASKVGGFEAVIPEVEGSAWITGRSEFWIDPSDPLREGFLMH